MRLWDLAAEIAVISQGSQFEDHTKLPASCLI